MLLPEVPVRFSQHSLDMQVYSLWDDLVVRLVKLRRLISLISTPPLDLNDNLHSVNPCTIFHVLQTSATDCTQHN